MSIMCQWIWRENLYGLCSGQFIQSFIYLLKIFFSFIFLFKFSAEFLAYDSWFLFIEILMVILAVCLPILLMCNF